MRMPVFAVVLIALAAAPLAAQTSPPASTAGTALSEDEKTIYALGLSLWRSLAPFDLSPAEVEIVRRALADMSAGREPAVKLEDYMAKIGPFQQGRAARRAEAEKVRGREFADGAAAEPGAVRTASGLVYRETQAGSGASPAATDTVEVHYRGTLTDGTEFDSSIARGKPAQFPLNRVIPCWTEALQKMKAGGKAKIVCPSDIAYGDRGRPTIPPGATLVFEVELLGIVATEPVPAPTPTPKPAPAPGQG